MIDIPINIHDAVIRKILKKIWEGYDTNNSYASSNYEGIEKSITHFLYWIINTPPTTIEAVERMYWFMIKASFTDSHKYDGSHRGADIIQATNHMVHEAMKLINAYMVVGDNELREIFDI